MARRALFRRTGAAVRLSRHLAARGRLLRRMHATTPVRFLRRLNMLPEDDRAAAPLWEALERWAIELGLLPARPAVETVEIETTFAPSEFTLAGDDRQAGPIASPAADTPRPTAASSSVSREHAATPLPPRERRAQPRVVTSSPAAARSVRFIPPVPSPRANAREAARESYGRQTSPVSAPASSAASAALPPVVAPSVERVEHVRPQERDADRVAPAPTPVVPVVEDVSHSAHGDAAASSAVKTGQRAEPPHPVVEVRPSDANVDVRAAVPADTRAVPADVPSIASADAPALNVPAPPETPRAPIETINQSFADIDAEIASLLAAAQTGDVEPVERAVAAEAAPVTTPRQGRRARVEELPVERSEPEPASTRSAAPRASRPASAPRSTPAPEPAPERESDRLFQPLDDGVDRSPAAWAARLARSMRPASTPASPSKPALPAQAAANGSRPIAPPRRVAPAPPGRAADVVQAVQIPQTTRRFLKPLVGVDTESVTILQGPLPTRVAAEFQADAVTVDADTVLVGPAFVGDLPRDVGLLAHELTHVARQRQPRFVPPVARGPLRGAAVPGEEEIARRVETQVIEAINEPAARVPAAPVDRGVHERQRSLMSHDEVTPVVEAGDAPSPARADVDWGGLPAPWEPLPAWLVESPAAVAAVQSSAPAARAAAPAAVAVAAPQPAAVQAADTGRVLDAPASPPPGAAPGGDAPAVEPDLDQLARQVYAVLKRRLDAEARREQMF